MNTELETRTETENKEPFRICDDRSANWVLRLLANNDAEKRRVAAQAEEMLRQIDADTAGLKYLYGAALEQYARQALAAAGNRRRSLALLQATLAFRTVAPALRIADPTAALAWAKQYAPDLVTVATTEQLDSKAFRDLAKATCNNDGELLPGIESSAGSETFSISFGKTE